MLSTQSRTAHLAQRLRVSDYKSTPQYRRLDWAQREAMECLLVDIERGEKQLYCDMPTGSGKTVVFLTLMELLATQIREGETPPRFLIMCPTRQLMTQTMDEAQIFAPNLFRDVGMLKFSAPDLDNEMLIGSYWAVSKHAETGLFHDGMFDLIVKDEDHEGLSERRKHAFALSLSQTVKTAFTATPSYTDDKSLEKAGYKLSYRLPFGTAVATRILAPIRNSFIEFHDPELSLRDVRLTSSGDLDHRDLGKVINNQGVARSYAHFYGGFTDPDTHRPLFGRSGINFCFDIDHAKMVSEEFNTILGPRMDSNTIMCLPIWGEISSRKVGRQSIGEIYDRAYSQTNANLLTLAKLERIANPLLDRIRKESSDGILTVGRVVTWMHRNGHILFASTADYLTRGYNARRAEIGFDFVPRTSLVMVGQIPGRLTRQDADNENKVGQIFSTIYPDTPRAKQVFPANFWGRSALFPAGDGTLSEVDSVLNPRASYTPPKGEDLLSFDLHLTERAVENYQKKRRLKRLQERYPFLTEVSPPIMRALLRSNLHRFDDFMKSLKQWAWDNHYMGETSEETDTGMLYALQAPKVKTLLRGGAYHRTYRTMEGDDKNLREYTRTAFAVAAMLKTPPEDLFGPLDSDAPLPEARELVDAAAHYMYNEGYDFDQDIPERDVFDPDDPFNEPDCEGFIYNPNRIDPLQNAIDDARDVAIRKALLTLTPREEFVIRSHFGLGEVEADETLETIGNVMSVTRERIRQIELKGIRKLRHPAKSRALRPYVEENPVTYAEVLWKNEERRRRAREAAGKPPGPV